MAGKMIAILFLARDVAHKEHLHTKSYAQHMALNTFYHDIIDLADQLAEAYQGRNGIIPSIPTVSMKGGKTIVTKMEHLLNMVETTRNDYASAGDTAIENIIDEIVGLFLSTLYKLKYLS